MPKFTQQINALLSTSFPRFFPIPSQNKSMSGNNITIFSQLENLIKYNKIKDHDVATFIKISDKTIISFAQLVHENNPFKMRIINLCRVKSNKFKGQGAKMLTHIIDYLELDENIIDHKVYLTVGATKTLLQMYYKALGWVNTHRYDIKADLPAYEFVYILNI